MDVSGVVRWWSPENRKNHLVISPSSEALLETYRNPLFLVRGDCRESSERPTSLCVVCRCNHYPLVGGVPARLIL